MSNFPLYDTLFKEVEDKDLTSKQKETLVKNVSKFDDQGYNLMFVLVKVHQIQTEDNYTNFTVPYGGKFAGNDLKFDIDKFPDKLKRIIYKFSQMHLKTMKSLKSK